MLKVLGLKERADYVIGNPPYAPMEKDIVIDTDDYNFLRSVKDAGSNLLLQQFIEPLKSQRMKATYPISYRRIFSTFGHTAF